MALLKKIRKWAEARRPVRTREEMLALFASFVGEKKVAQLGRELVLEDAAAGFEAPPAILFILFASRAGSSYCGRLLSKTPYFQYVAEAFKPKHLEEVRSRRDFATHSEAAQWMIEHWGSPHGFGMKAGFNVLIGAAHLGFLPQVLDRAQFVLLRRRDKVAQAVSLLKGNLSGQMHSIQPDGRSVTAAEYDAAAIAENIAHIARNESYFEEIARRLGKRPPLLYYEDVCADPGGFVAQICDLLGLPFPADYDPEVDLEVMRDEVSEQWAARFRAEHPEAA